MQLAVRPPDPPKPIEKKMPKEPVARLPDPPPDPPKQVEEKPREAPVAKPVKHHHRPRPKPAPVAEAEAKPDPAPPQPATRSIADPAPERREIAAAPTAPAPNAASTASIDRVAAPVPDQGPVVVMNPDYREPPQPPIYPPRSVTLGQQGRVVIRASIDHEGVPESVVVWESSGHPLLDSAAVTAVKRWRFVPARRGGVPVAAWVQVPVNFRLR